MFTAVYPTAASNTAVERYDFVMWRLGASVYLVTLCGIVQTSDMISFLESLVSDRARSSQDWAIEVTDGHLSATDSDSPGLPSRLNYSD